MWSELGAQGHPFLWAVEWALREGPLRKWRQSRAAFCGNFAIQRSSCELGAGVGGGVKRVFLDGAEAAG